MKGLRGFLLIGIIAGAGQIVLASAAKNSLAVVTYVSSHEQERSVTALIKSIRRFGGRYGSVPVFVVTSDEGELPCRSLQAVGVSVAPLRMDPSFRDYPLAIKAFAAAQAEEKLKDEVGTLAWLDPGLVVLNTVDCLDLAGRFTAALRPVSLDNTIGLAAGARPNDYWGPIYGAVGIDARTVPAVTTVVDEMKINAYYNCEIFSIDPKLGIFRKWAEILSELLKDEAFQRTACTTFKKRLFLHQAVLSAVVTSKAGPAGIKPLPLACSYPFNQHPRLPAGKAITALNELSAVIFDDAWTTGPGWLDKIPCQEPLRSWLQQTYREYLEPGDVLKSEPNEKSGKYLFYLHGKIIEDQGIPRPRSEKFGYYEYEKILAAFRDRGFTVISEMRPANTEVRAYAEKVAGEIKKLLRSGVAPDRITVAGASKGGIIAIFISALLQNRNINFVFLSSCYEAAFKDLQDMGTRVAGNILSIYDDADDTGCGSCRRFFDSARGKELGRTKEIRLHMGLGHGILYRPYAEWVEPLSAWADDSGVAGK